MDWAAFIGVIDLRCSDVKIIFFLTIRVLWREPGLVKSVAIVMYLKKNYVLTNYCGIEYKNLYKNLTNGEV